MASDASFDYTKKAQYSAYSMANIIPQYYLINRHIWSKAEVLERELAVRLNLVYVLNGVEYSDNPPRMGKNMIAYPSAYWKIITDRRHTSICLRYINTDKVNVKKDKLLSHVVDCSTLKTPKGWVW